MTKPASGPSMGGQSISTIPLYYIGASGYCTCSKGAACGKNSAKHPSVREWTDPAQHTRYLREELLDELAEYQETGQVPHYGVICGEVNDLVVVDVDPRNGGFDVFNREAGFDGHEAAERASNAVITPKGGFHLYFRLSSLNLSPGTKLPGKLGPGVDLLSTGKFVVGPGCVQNNGVAYRVASSEDELPQWNPAPAWLKAWINKIASEPSIRKARQRSDSDTAPIAEVLSLLQYIDGTEYYPWLMVGMALHYEYSGNEHALALWKRWSKRFPSWESEDVCEKKWDSFGKNGETAASMVTLGTLVFMAREGGWQGTIQIIKDVEEEWEKTSTGPAVMDDTTISGPPEAVMAKLRRRYSFEGPFPEHEPVFPGFGFGVLKEYAEIIFRHAHQPDPVIAMAGSLVFMAMLFSRRWMWHAADTRLYVMLAVPTAFGKGILEQTDSMMHTALGTMGTLKGAPVSSDVGLLENLMVCPRKGLVIDEMGDYMKGNNAAKKSGGYGHKIEALIKSLFSCTSHAIAPTAKRKASFIQHPAVCILGTTTPGDIMEGLTPSQFRGGLVSRFLFFVKTVEEDLLEPNTQDYGALRRDIRELAKKLVRMDHVHLGKLAEKQAKELAEADPVGSMGGGGVFETSGELRSIGRELAEVDKQLAELGPMGFEDFMELHKDDHDEESFESSSLVSPGGYEERFDVEPTWLHLESDEAADVLMKQIDGRIRLWHGDGGGKNEMLWSFWNRFPLMVKKVTMIAAIAANTNQPRVHREHVQWAFDLCLWCYTRFSQQMFEPMMASQMRKQQGAQEKYTHEDMQKVVLWAVDIEGAIPQRAYHSKFYAIGNRKVREALLDDLVSQGVLEIVSMGRGQSYRANKEAAWAFLQT